MKRIVILLAILCIVCIGGYMYLYVDGENLPGVADMGGDCTVTVSRYLHMDWENRSEVILDDQQTAELQKLLVGGAYTRNMRGYVTFPQDTWKYDIRIEPVGGDVVTLQCIGGEYLMPSHGAEPQKYLNIGIEDFQQRLEGIIKTAAK